MNRKVLFASLAITTLILAITASGSPKPEEIKGSATSTAKKTAKHTSVEGVEISSVNSVIQKGVKPANQMNLEKAIRLMTTKQKRSKSSPSAGAKISSGGRSRPGGRGGPGKDTRRSVPHRDRIINEGS
jgi:hypothetical protein